jgi:hypothetical protein
MYRYRYRIQPIEDYEVPVPVNDKKRHWNTNLTYHLKMLNSTKRNQINQYKYRYR